MSARDDALQAWTLSGVADAVRSGALAAIDAVDLALDRIEKDTFNSFVSINAEGARAQARRIDALIKDGVDPGPLAGAPIGVKDLIETVEGMVTTEGSLLCKDEPVAPQDSPHVARLRAAGAVIVGRTAAAEFGMDSATSTRAHGVTRNPWSRDHTPGGSSGGSAAAVSGGLVPFASATDDGGSIRAPASHCNLVGFKPSFGRVPQPPGGNTLNALGGLAKTVRDAARHLDVAAGPHRLDRFSLPSPERPYELAIETLDVAGVRTVYSADLGYAPVHAEIAAITAEAAGRLTQALNGAEIPLTVTLTNPYPAYVVAALDRLRRHLNLRHGGRRDLLCEHLRVGLDLTEGLTPDMVHAAGLQAQQLEAEVAQLFSSVDLVMTPVTVSPPHLVDLPTPDEMGGVSLMGVGVENFPMWANFTGCPSISVPAGFTEAGLPVGLLITGPRLHDDLVLRAARLWEQASPWALTPP